jgi:hypothetical protein
VMRCSCGAYNSDRACWYCGKIALQGQEKIAVDRKITRGNSNPWVYVFRGLRNDFRPSVGQTANTEEAV